MLAVRRSSHPEGFFRKGVLKICSKFTGEHPSRSAISVKLLCNFIEITLWLGCSLVNLQSNFIEITLRHGCSPVNLLHIFRTLFPRNTSGGMLLGRAFSSREQQNNIGMIESAAFTNPLWARLWKHSETWDKVSRNGARKICRRQLWKVICYFKLRPYHFVFFRDLLGPFFISSINFFTLNSKEQTVKISSTFTVKKIVRSSGIFLYVLTDFKDKGACAHIPLKMCRRSLRILCSRRITCHGNLSVLSFQWCFPLRISW